MSSSYVRTQVKDYLTANWVGTNTFVDVSDFKTMKDLPVPPENVLMVEFISQTESNISLGGGDCYREIGIINGHILVPTGYSSTDALSVCEQFRDLFRGKRINNMTIQAVNPPSNLNGVAISFEGIYSGWAIQLDYICDFFY